MEGQSISSGDEDDARLLADRDIPALLARYYPVILNRLRLRLPEGEATEVAHRVLERLIREIEAGRSYSVPYRVVVHKVVDWTLREYFAPPRDGALPEDWDGPDDDDPYGKVEDDLLLTALLADLPPRVREVMTLRYRDGLEIADIAERLGMERNAVDQALFRGRRALARELRPDA